MSSQKRAIKGQKTRGEKRAKRGRVTGWKRAMIWGEDGA